MTRKSAVINQVSETGYVEVNPSDAERLNINDGDSIRIATRRGNVTTWAKVTEEIQKGWIFMPFHFAEGPANMLTSDALDPIAKIPEFKVCAAVIEKTEMKGQSR